ncbi:hypothetical protein TNCV_2912631 [Trichonephila clavipes]|nr:hypothetical protein TNCV_2912631 [Trichonephila clavipes]
MINDDEIVTSVQEESDPIDDETDEDADNNESSKCPSNADAFSALDTAMEWDGQHSKIIYLFVLFVSLMGEIDYTMSVKLPRIIKGSDKICESSKEASQNYPTITQSDTAYAQDL